MVDPRPRPPRRFPDTRPPDRSEKSLASTRVTSSIAPDRLSVSSLATRMFLICGLSPLTNCDTAVYSGIPNWSCSCVQRTAYARTDAVRRRCWYFPVATVIFASSGRSMAFRSCSLNSSSSSKIFGLTFRCSVSRVSTFPRRAAASTSDFGRSDSALCTA